MNVARVVARLGHATQALVVAGGSTGTRVRDLLAAEGLDVVAVEIDGETRQSVTVNERSTGRQYRFVLPGPPIEGEAVEALAGHLRARAADIACLVLSGSLPPGTPPDGLATLVSAVPDAMAIIDTSGPGLPQALASPAMLLKPSARELASVAGRALPTEADIATAASEVVASSSVGAILVSIGAGGAFLVDAERTVRLRAPTVDVRSAVGAGDSLVAGTALGLCRGLDLVEAAALGVAAGTAAVLTDGTELCTPEGVAAMRPLVTIG